MLFMMYDRKLCSVDNKVNKLLSKRLKRKQSHLAFKRNAQHGSISDKTNGIIIFIGIRAHYYPLRFEIVIFYNTAIQRNKR